MKKNRHFKLVPVVALLIIFLFRSTSINGYAQGETPTPPAPAPVTGPEYIVQPGDSLWSIALRFRVSIDDLSAANNMVDANQLAAGDRLVIPGLVGMQGTLTTIPVAFGESLTSLSRSYQIPAAALIQLNHLTSPAELYAGTNLVVLETGIATQSSRRTVLAPGQSLLELAVSQGISPWSYILINNLSSSAMALPGDVLQLINIGPSQPQPTSEPPITPGAEPETPQAPGALPDAIRSITIDPLPLVQGGTMAIRVKGEPGLKIGGALIERPLNVFSEDNGDYSGLQGIHAMTDPGLYPLVITGTLPGGASFAFSQAVFVASGDYVYDPPLAVSPETIDPAATQPEDAQWAALTAPVSPERLWSGIFSSPAPPIYADCWPSMFGSRRSYNGSEYNFFHTGLDFCGGVGTEIFAPATGEVVFAGPLTVRGNATVINHGQGVYTGYLHQSEITVSVGDQVQAGQIIGKVGGTGRVTGPHLHWEVWVGGVQVEPMDWLTQVFPPEF